MKTLFLAWQNPNDRSWQPVGRLSLAESRYQFVYTQGARAEGFFPLGNMTDFYKRYESVELFPLFANRILSKSRPEYAQLLHWLDLNPNEDDPLQLLALTEGIRKTDTLMLFPPPEEDKDGNFCARFFCHGVRHVSADAIQRVNSLKPGEPLFLMYDIQNEFDECAIALRTGDPKTIVGYCPRYLASDFRQVLSYPRDALVSVEKVNRDAPIQLRLLCSIVGPWPNDFAPCQGGAYTPLAD